MSAVKEDLTYAKGDGRSFFLDLAGSVIPDVRAGCDERLAQHAAEVGSVTALPDHLREAWKRGRDAASGILSILNWIDLPPTSDSVNIPKIGTPATEFDCPMIAANVVVNSGSQGIAQGLVRQSPIALDEIVTRDLTDDYLRNLSNQLYRGAGSRDEVVGLDNTPGIQVFERPGPKGFPAEVWASAMIADVASELDNIVKPDVALMSPERFKQLLPLSTSTCGSKDHYLHDLRMVPDECVDSDVVYILTSSHLTFFCGEVNGRALLESRDPEHPELARVLFQIWSHVAFTAARLPGRIARLSGMSLGY